MRILLFATTTGYQIREFENAARALGHDVWLATDRCHLLDDPWADRLMGDDSEPVNQTLSRLETLELPCSTSVVPWGTTDYLEELVALAESREMTLEDCAREFGTIDLPKSENEQKWLYHPLLGFRRLPVRQ